MFTARVFDHKGICVNLWQEKTALECLQKITEYIAENGFNFDFAECEKPDCTIQWQLFPREVSTL